MGWIIPHRWDPLGNSHYHQRRATHPHITTGEFGYKGMASWNFFGFHFFLCVKSWDLRQAWKYRRVWVWRTFSDLSWLRFPATWRVFLRWSWTIARMAAMVAGHSWMRWCSWNSPPRWWYHRRGVVASSITSRSDARFRSQPSEYDLFNLPIPARPRSKARKECYPKSHNLNWVEYWQPSPKWTKIHAEKSGAAYRTAETRPEPDIDTIDVKGSTLKHGWNLFGLRDLC